MILLTEEEIVAEASRDKEYCQLAVDVGMWARKEQLKKVVEWLDSPCTHELGWLYKWSCLLCRKELKEEAGL